MGVVGAIIYILIHVVIFYIDYDQRKKYGLKKPRRACSGSGGSYYEVAPDGNCELFDGYGNLIE